MAIGKRPKRYIRDIQTPPKGEQLEAKMKLLALLPYDERARRKHCLVFGFIVDWYYDDYGNALAAALFVADQLEQRRHQIPNGKGLCRSQVHSALTDLVAWGFLIEIKGTGRSASRYVPNWSLVWPLALKQLCVLSCQEANSVPSCQDDRVLNAEDTKVACVLGGGAQDPFTRPGQRPRDGLNGNHSPAALSGIAGSAVAAGEPEGARDPGGFSEFWTAYPKKLKRQRTLAAYEKVAPDAELRAIIVAKARELAAHHKEHKTEFKWIREPQNWLAQEGWLEDPPPPYGKPETKPATKKKASAPKSNPPAPANSNRPAVDVWKRVKIERSRVEELPEGGRKLVLTGDADDGTMFIDTFILDHHDEYLRADGERRFASLRQAVNVLDIEDSDVLHGIEFERRIVDGRHEYQPVAEKAA